MLMIKCDICGKKLKDDDINIIKVDNAWRYDCCNNCKEKLKSWIEKLINEGNLSND